MSVCQGKCGRLVGGVDTVREQLQGPPVELHYLCQQVEAALQQFLVAAPDFYNMPEISFD